MQEKDCLHTIITGQTSPENTQQEEIGFTPARTIGLPPERIETDSPICFARQTNILGGNEVIRSVYYLRMAVNGHLVDPWNVVTQNVDRRYAQHAGKTEDQFKKVTERCFQLYMRYLQTRNTANYLNAEREFVTS